MQLASAAGVALAALGRRRSPPGNGVRPPLTFLLAAIALALAGLAESRPTAAQPPEPPCVEANPREPAGEYRLPQSEQEQSPAGLWVEEDQDCSTTGSTEEPAWELIVLPERDICASTSRPSAR